MIRRYLKHVTYVRARCSAVYPDISRPHTLIDLSLIRPFLIHIPTHSPPTQLLINSKLHSLRLLAKLTLRKWSKLSSAVPPVRSPTPLVRSHTDPRSRWNRSTPIPPPQAQPLDHRAISLRCRQRRWCMYSSFLCVIIIIMFDRSLLTCPTLLALLRLRASCPLTMELRGP